MINYVGVRICQGIRMIKRSEMHKIARLRRIFKYESSDSMASSNFGQIHACRSSNFGHCDDVTFRPSKHQNLVNKMVNFQKKNLKTLRSVGLRPPSLRFRKVALLMLFSYSLGFFKEKSFEKMRLMSLFSK